MSGAAPDPAAVAAWMAAHVPGFRGPVALRQFAQGQSNPTFRVDAASGAYVLRRKPPGALLKSAHAVDREYRVQRALWATPAPVPQVLALCEDAAVIGAMFYVMALVPGRSFDQPQLPGVAAGERAAIYASMNAALAAIHDVDIDAAGLSDFGAPGDYYARQLARWGKQYAATATEALPAMDALMDWLHGALPPDDGRRGLVHGDFRIDNLLFAPDGPGCVAVLDWELSTLGHPFADLAAVLMQWRMPVGAQGRGLEGLDRAALGLPSEAAFIADYCARRGLAGVGDFRFHLAFAFFRMAAILQGVKKRALDGNAANPARGLELGAMVPDFAARGLAAARDG